MSGRVYIAIQAHGDALHLSSLLTELNHPEIHGTVHFDGDVDSFKRIQRITKRCNPSFHCVSSIPGHWGGASLLMQLREALSYAVEEKDFQTFVNLSAECMPLTSAKNIVDRLATERQNGRRSFCHAFAMRREIPWLIADDLRQRQTVALKYRRSQVYTTPELAEKFRFGSLDPARRPQDRLAVHCTDDLVGDRLIVRRLLPHEASDRRRLIVALGGAPFMGRHWAVLSREMSEWLVSSPFCAAVAAMLHGCFMAEESFLQNCLLASQCPLRDEVVLDNLRYEQADPAAVILATKRDLRQSGALFARKRSILKTLL